MRTLGSFLKQGNGSFQVLAPQRAHSPCEAGSRAEHPQLTQVVRHRARSALHPKMGCQHWNVAVRMLRLVNMDGSIEIDQESQTQMVTQSIQCCIGI